MLDVLNSWPSLSLERVKDRSKLKTQDFFFLSSKVLCSIFDLFCFPQDILENESINLDWMFRYSLINDIVKVGGGQTVNKNRRESSTEVLTYIIYSDKCCQNSSLFLS